jgi:hypothetical protein
MKQGLPTNGEKNTKNNLQAQRMADVQKYRSRFVLKEGMPENKSTQVPS